MKSLLRNWIPACDGGFKKEEKKDVRQDVFLKENDIQRKRMSEEIRKRLAGRAMEYLMFLDD